MRGWLNQNKKVLNSLKQEFKKFSKDQVFSPQLNTALGLLDFEKQPYSQKFEKDQISWYPVSHSPFAFELKNYLTGDTILIDRG